jgi:hypothetical protein
MGSLYRPTYRAADGSQKESAIIWLKYRDALGVLRRESSETTKEQEAKRLLKQREGAAVEGASSRQAWLRSQWPSSPRTSRPSTAPTAASP